jgi:hypothetical protein
MQKKSSPENPLLNLAINILLPVMVLNKGSKFLGPKGALLLALAFPLLYGAYDYLKRNHKNYVSLIGLINIALTGGLALMSLRGGWFAAKEALLPAVLGLMVLGSLWSNNPAAKMLFYNPQILNVAVIEAQLLALNGVKLFESLLRRTTLWLSLSFFISASLNFILAVQIFADIDLQLSPEAQEQILNEQIAHMTWMGFVVIALPLMVFSGVLVYFFLRSLSKLTKVPIQELINS